jgi:hypothetical protein
MELAGKYTNNLKGTGYEPGSDPRDFLLEPNFLGKSNFAIRRFY